MVDIAARTGGVTAVLPLATITTVLPASDAGSTPKGA